MFNFTLQVMHEYCVRPIAGKLLATCVQGFKHVDGEMSVRGHIKCIAGDVTWYLCNFTGTHH